MKDNRLQWRKEENSIHPDDFHYVGAYLGYDIFRVREYAEGFNLNLLSDLLVDSSGSYIDILDLAEEYLEHPMVASDKREAERRAIEAEVNEDHAQAMISDEHVDDWGSIEDDCDCGCDECLVCMGEDADDVDPYAGDYYDDIGNARQEQDALWCMALMQSHDDVSQWLPIMKKFLKLRKNRRDVLKTLGRKNILDC